MVGTGYGQWMRTGSVSDLRYFDAKVTRTCEVHGLEGCSAEAGSWKIHYMIVDGRRR